MPSDLLFWLALTTKIAVPAVLVVIAAWAAERAGPLIGAMVATLPISVGTAYAFVALDQDAGFIAASALGSLSSNAANAVFCAVYIVAAQTRGLGVSLAAALAAWTGVALALHAVDWTLAGVVGVNAVVFAACLPVAWRFRAAPMPPVVRRPYDIPLRAGLVAALVLAVVGASARLGPGLTGIFALFPVVLSSIVLIFHPRTGGRATAAIMANGIPGLAGIGLGFVVLNLAAVPAGKWAALTLALAMSCGWNLLLFATQRRSAAAAQAAVR